MRWIALLFLLPVSAWAVDLTCTVPTENTDGSTLTDLADIKVYWGTTQGGPYDLGSDSMGVDCQHTLNLPAGTYYFVATAINSAGVESDYSNEATRTVLPPQPQPPTNLAVTASNLTAYAISQTEDRLVTYPVGTVSEGTSCDASMTVNGKYLVPRSAVQWAGTVQPQVVVAECG